MPAIDPAVAVLVVGAGAMGSGIAQVAARAGHSVYLYDQNDAAAARGRAAVEEDLRFLVGKGRLAEAEAAATLARIRAVASLDAAAGAGLAIKAIVERLEAKRALFLELEGRLGAGAILATNTSSLSITALAAPLAHPGRLAGLHFFNPAPRMALVEVISGLVTDPAVADRLHATASAWGKVPVRARSTPGFIVNRVARPFYAEGLRALEEGAATAATLDALLREACGFPMGPFELMDLIGHDVNYAVTSSVFDAFFGDRRFTPSLLQQELLLAGRLGRKSGAGFYRYGEGVQRPAATLCAAQPAPAQVVLVGEADAAPGLAGRLEAAGVAVSRLRAPGVATLALSDGRTATARAAAEGIDDLVLFDLALDYATTPRLAIAAADQCGEGVAEVATGALQAAGIAVSRLDDVAGLIGLRTVCMLVNEAADAVTRGVASAADIDAAMRHGTHYPLGPLAWGDRLGAGFVAAVLDNLHRHYGDERYRVSPLIRRRALAGGRFHAEG